MGVIEFKHFSKSFGKKAVHKDVTFKVNAGECLGLIGGSGAGKSVILRSLIGLEKPDSGDILVNGVNISRMNEFELKDIRLKVAYVFQNGALFDSMTVYENLAYPLRAHTNLSEDQMREKIMNLLSRFGLSKADQVYPSNLSGGMQKRVGLARAIIMNPDIVLYDEPTAGLDPYNTRKIQEMMLDLKEKGTTSIFVTHDIPSAMAVCDRIAMLVDGVIRIEKTKKEILDESDGLIHRFINGEEP